MKTLLISLSLIVASHAAATKTKLSSFVPICSRSDPNLNECVLKSANAIMPALGKGIREYGFPPLDPLKIPFMGLSQSDGPAGLKLNITDSTHTGLKDMKISAAKVDLKTNVMTFDLEFPPYYINGTCDLGGKILLLPINGHGACLLSSFNMSGILTLRGNMETKNGKEYLILSNPSIDITFRKGGLVIEGLFGGNKQLGETMNRFLNENAVEVFNEMRTTLEKVWADLFGGLVSRLTSSVPFDDMFRP